MDESARGAIGGQGGEGGAGFATFADFHGSLFASHIGFDPAGVSGVDLDIGVAELMGKVNGEGVERGL